MKIINLVISILVVLYTSSAFADMNFTNSTLSSSPTAELSSQIIIDPTFPTNVIPEIIQKDSFNSTLGKTVTYQADIKVNINTGNNISLNKFKEFGMNNQSADPKKPNAEMNIINTSNARIIIFEVDGRKSSSIANTTMTIIGNKADFALVNKSGSIFTNFITKNFAGWSQSKGTSQDIIAKYAPSNLIKEPSFAIESRVGEIFVEKDGTIKPSIY